MNDNQINYRVQQQYNVISELDEADRQIFFERLLKRFGYTFVLAIAEDGEEEVTSFSASIKRAIQSGLDQANPQMVRAAMEWEADQAGRDYLSELHVEIVPYRVKDDSLSKIVLEAGEETVAEIEAALSKRRQLHQGN